MNYTIVSGDTLWNIAKRYNTTVNAILAANPQIKDPNIIIPGQVIFIPTATVPIPPEKCPTLSIGSTGQAVLALQNLLKSAGFDPGPLDGIFGPLTQAAVIAFQEESHLVQDGIVGIQTWTNLGVKCN